MRSFVLVIFLLSSAVSAFLHPEPLYADDSHEKEVNEQSIEQLDEITSYEPDDPESPEPDFETDDTPVFEPVDPQEAETLEEETYIDVTDSDDKEKVSTKEESEIKNNDKPEKKAPVAPPKPEVETPVRKDAVPSELLTIKDGDYLYERIPGFKIETPEMTEKNDENSLTYISSENNQKEIASAVTESDKSGLLGLSRDATENVIKIFFILLILLIIVLYRSRSNENSGRVLRSIPKK